MDNEKAFIPNID